MSKGKGRNFTRSQREFLIKNGIDPEKYLYLKTETVSISLGHLNKTDTKVQYMHILNKETGNKEEIQM